MPQLVALSVSIGVLGGLATWLFLSTGLPIWAAFIAWACFFLAGGDTKALQNTIVCSIFGAICAWVAAIVILGVPLAGVLTLPLWGGIVVGVTVLLMCLAAHIKALSTIPASVLGYAATAAYFLQTTGALSLDKLTSVTLGNALIIVVIAMVIGAILGLLSGKLAGALTGKAAA